MAVVTSLGSWVPKCEFLILLAEKARYYKMSYEFVASYGRSQTTCTVQLDVLHGQQFLSRNRAEIVNNKIVSIVIMSINVFF